ncbi:hypothetical protein J5226_08455 [Lysobacter sp. K5869]|uniref:hypothetical protein n=1 Tax=Lysobacter sp. K5869 TaxID=2820808 RepID=UPI001C063920|nr:hypothetical protein [Lysobacter sp. K5869]QWP78408.1 hypothetical protein J5226_08455 [Lysobacter sp. K5869]
MSAIANQGDAARLLEFLHGEWRRCSPGQLRRGVWVSQHEPIAADAEGGSALSQPLLRAWWMDWDGIELRPALSFKLFCDHLKPRDAQTLYEIGMSNFAAFPHAPFYCVDTVRGPLDGDGWRVRVTQAAVDVLEKRWVS